MLWWLWNRRYDDRATTARPTVIFPTAGGPRITSRCMRGPYSARDASTSTRFPWPSKVWSRTWPGNVSRWLSSTSRPSCRKPAGDLVEVVDDEGRVRLPCRRERVLDADVQLGRDRALVVVRPEPAAAAGDQVGRLVDLGHAEPVGVEPARDVLTAGRAGDLDVVQPHGAGTGVASGLRATTKIRRNGRITRPAASAG